MNQTRKITYTALFISLAILLPFITFQIPSIGQLLTPMHFPVIIGALLLGPFYGALIGIISPLLRFLLFGMPILPVASAMAIELAIYAVVISVVMKLLKKVEIHHLAKLYISLIIAMLLGRVGFALAAMIFMNAPSFQVVFISTFSGSSIGILLQLILIPMIYVRIHQNKNR